MDRKITFPNVGVIKGSRVWRNSGTGVEIVKGKNFEEVGLYYVCHPTQAHDGRAVGFIATTLKGAREFGGILVRRMRRVIAEAYDAATLENEGRQIRTANQHRQISTWMMRHDIALSFDSAPDVLAGSLTRESPGSQPGLSSRDAISGSQERL